MNHISAKLQVFSKSKQSCKEQIVSHSGISKAISYWNISVDVSLGVEYTSAIRYTIIF